MATLTTKETGGMAPLMTTASFSPPECAVPPGELEAFMPGTGLNGLFMADLLSSFLMHEQCGLHLYRTAFQYQDMGFGAALAWIGYGLWSGSRGTTTVHSWRRPPSPDHRRSSRPSRA